MFRRLALFIMLISVMASPVFAADWWVVPYGNFNIYSDHASASKLQINNPAISEPGMDISQSESGVGGGLTIAADFEGIGGVLGFNFEYMGATEDFVLAEVDPLLGTSDLSLDYPAFAVGGFFAGELPWLTSDSFRGLLGLELGIIKASGSITVQYTEEVISFDVPPITTYEPREEKQDLSNSSLYMSLFLTEDYSLFSRFALTGTVGYRTSKAEIQSVSTKSMSGAYGQDYSGFFVRMGIRVDI